MDLAWWPGPAEYVVDLEAFKAAATKAGQIYMDAIKGIVKIFNGQDWQTIGRLASAGTHDSGRAIDINVTGVSMSDIHEIRERLVKELVSDFDASPELAEKAVLKVDQEHLDEYEDFDDLIEFVYSHEPFWVDSE